MPHTGVPWALSVDRGVMVCGLRCDRSKSAVSLRESQVELDVVAQSLKPPVLIEKFKGDKSNASVSFSASDSRHHRS